jgi:hypothetical protein
MTTPSLDPRKSPYKRGDIVTLGFNRVGLVREFTPAYLEVRWNDEGNEGHDKIERIPTADIDNLVRVGHADGLYPGESKTNLQMLEDIESLERVRALTVERTKTIKSAREQAHVNSLITRAHAKDRCDWDKQHYVLLMKLALEPWNVGLIPKLQERLHRVFCKRHAMVRRQRQ